MRISLSSILILIFCRFSGYAQQKLILPNYPNWNIVNEGQELKFKLAGSTNNTWCFSLQQGKQLGMNLDSSGLFTWTPSFDVVSRLEKSKLFQFIVEATNTEGHHISSSIEVIVNHVNRPPKINQLTPFYVKNNVRNTYKINNFEVLDEDQDPIVFIPNIETFPEGMTMTSEGEFNFSPSNTQFRTLKEVPTYIEFYVQDFPSKSETKGRIKLETTQLDLAPTINVLPNEKIFRLKENENINLKFYLSDANGDDDIQIFDFVTNQNVNKECLSKISNTQYVFSWKPGFDFVSDSLEFSVDFFALDKSQKREVKTINFVVKNAINEVEVDKKNYALYFGTLQRATELLDQLREKEEELKKEYKKASKGKKSRAVVTASLGAATGLSSLYTTSAPNTQRFISTFGGTTVMTIGTLEATEVIGKSMKSLLDRLNSVVEKKNELQTKGDIFARDFALKANRKTSYFVKSMDDLNNVMNLKGLIVLELNAVWESKTKIDEAKVKKNFNDFVAL